MKIDRYAIRGVILGAAVLLAAPAQAQLGLKDCSDKYTAAKAAGTAGNKSFADFRKSDCGPGSKPAAAPAAGATTTQAPPATPSTAPAPAAPAAPAKGKAAKTAAPSGPVTGPVFPDKISDAHKSKRPSKARMATCLDQYRANKPTNANGGLKWIQKGGGYFSQCNKKLKG